MRSSAQSVALAVMLVVTTGCSKSSDKDGSGRKDPPSAVAREDFRKAVIKTPQEVIGAVGKPDSTQDHGNGAMIWFYANKTKDPFTGKVDQSTQLVFLNDTTKDVVFFQRPRAPEQALKPNQMVCCQEGSFDPQFGSNGARFLSTP